MKKSEKKKYKCPVCGIENVPLKTHLGNCGQPWKVVVSCPVCRQSAIADTLANALAIYVAGKGTLEVQL